MEDKAKQRIKLEGVPGGVPLVTSGDQPHVIEDDEDLPEPGQPWIPIVLAVALVAVLSFWFVSNRAPLAPKKAPVVPVKVAAVEIRAMPVEVRTIGNVSPINSVAIKSRIEGHITRVAFKEGADVHKGDLLFTIDARPMQASVTEMQANVAKMEAGVAQAQANLKRDYAMLLQARAQRVKDTAQQKLYAKEISRYSYLQRQGAVSEEQVDMTRANADGADATIHADEAAIENCQANIAADTANLANARAQLQAAQAQLDNAHLDLGFTSLRAPMDGRTGSLMAFEGNLVKANEQTLVTINQVKPIYVTFGVPEQALADVRKYADQGRLTVLAFPPGRKEGISGQLTFSENAVDPATGTIRLKATYPNATSELWPGQFVDVVLRLREEPNAVVVPQHAVQSGQQGQFAYVLKPDQTVEFRAVQADRTIGDWTVITAGVKPGEQVVVDGHLQLTAGSKVMVKGAAGPAK